MDKIYGQIIVGAGFAGLCAAIRLKEIDENDFIVLEKNDHWGGTWYDNHYPGAACDVQSHLYSFSFEPNPDWSRKFGPQEEILHYMDHCVRKYNLVTHIRLSTAVRKIWYTDADSLWNVQTENGEILKAKFLVACPGGLSQPNYPDIKGLSAFSGELFHSARWPENVSLKGKKVGVIGTGASAIQIVPSIANEVESLIVFQRTPPWILPKPDGPIAGWQKWLYKNIPLFQKIYRSYLYWTHELTAVGFVKWPGLLRFSSTLSLRYIRKTITDEKLREKLTPGYTMGCKRILISNEYYQSLSEKNVFVETSPIQEITQKGVVTNSANHDLDVLILATGFHATDGVMRFELTGRNAIDINEKWKNGAEAYLGTNISDFPNLFLIVGPNTGLGHSSMILMIEAQVNLMIETLKFLKSNHFKTVDVKTETMEDFNLAIQQKLKSTVWQQGGCVSWYQNRSGKITTLWPGFTFTFINKTKRFEPEKYDLR